MNTSTIRTTVNEALAANGMQRYSNYAEPVITALEAQVEETITKAREVMSEMGVDERSANEVLVRIGLVPEPEVQAPTTLASSGDDTAAQVAALTEQVASLVALARANGLLR